MSDDLGARIEVTGGDRPRLRLVSGQLRAQQLHGFADRPRVALIAATALLLGGDRVELDVRLGPGARLDLIEVAGTVAYPGPPAAWGVRLDLAAGAELRFPGQPFVVAAGATVDRTLDAHLANDARLVMRETVVLGRHGEIGGGGANRSRVAVGGRPVLVEDQPLDPGVRARPGVLGTHRVLDAVTGFGCPTPDVPTGATLLRLVDDAGWSLRWLGPHLDRSPLGHALP